MLAFDLPVLDVSDPLMSAFAAVMQRDISGVVVRHPGEYRLLHLDDLRRAFDQGKTAAGEIESFTPLRMAGAVSGENLRAAFEETGFRYLLLNETADGVRLMSSQEPLGNIYLTAPTVVKCTNPNTTHRYPPHRRSPGQTKCTFDPYPLV